MEFLISACGLGIGILGVIFAYIQNKDKEKLEDFCRLDNWHSYYQAETHETANEREKVKD